MDITDFLEKWQHPGASGFKEALLIGAKNNFSVSEMRLLFRNEMKADLDKLIENEIGPYKKHIEDLESYTNIPEDW